MVTYTREKGGKELFGKLHYLKAFDNKPLSGLGK